MKEVTFKGSKSGEEVGGVVIGDVTYPLNVPVVVKDENPLDQLELPGNAEIKKDYKFSVKEAKKGAEEGPQIPETSEASGGGFGGAEGSASESGVPRRLEEKI